MRTGVLILLAVACAGPTAPAEDRPPPGLPGELRDLVRLHGRGKETRTRSENRITIEYDSMAYHVHNPDRTGRMQRWSEELGPRRGGVVIEIDLLSGPYGGPMVLPQRLKGPYYATWCSEVEEGSRHFFLRARFGDRFPAKLKLRILERIGFRAGVDRPAFPVRVQARPGGAGEPLRLRVTLTNGLKRPIRFTTFGTKPSGSNGETLNISVIDIYRNKERQDLYRARPELRIPLTVSGPASLPVPPGGSLDVWIDVGKWKISGGWTPGDYELLVRMDNISVDDKIRLSVLSDPVRISLAK